MIFGRLGSFGYHLGSEGCPLTLKGDYYEPPKAPGLSTGGSSKFYYLEWVVRLGPSFGLGPGPGETTEGSPGIWDLYHALETPERGRRIFKILKLLMCMILLFGDSCSTSISAGTGLTLFWARRELSVPLLNTSKLHQEPDFAKVFQSKRGGRKNAR